MQDKSNDTTKLDFGHEDCIWSPKILSDILESIDLVRKQLQAKSNLDEMSLAINKDVPFGINAPPLNLEAKVDRVLKAESVPVPLFYLASEMAAARRVLSRKNQSAISTCKIRSARMTPLCKRSDASLK